MGPTGDRWVSARAAVKLEVGPFDPRCRCAVGITMRRSGARSDCCSCCRVIPRLDWRTWSSAWQPSFRPALDEIAERAYQAVESVFVVRVSIPELVAAAVQACDELAGLLEELDQWVNDKQANLLEAPEDVKRYRAAYLAQACEQLQAARR